MEYTAYSRIRLINNAQEWSVTQDIYDPLSRYLLYGLMPGSFWSAVLINDWAEAISRSHPGNNIEELKNATRWIASVWPEESHGSIKNVKAWNKMEDLDRRAILVRERLVYTEQEEVMMALSSRPVEDEEWVRKVWF